ncbi:MAG: hypothetical protein HY689_16330 [Chloroflexi bacterium]|nr:hypothetical protein [Chloroflexota bacterium]
MAGTITITEVTYTSVRKVTLEWTSDASGNADATTTKAFTGEVVRAVQLPDSGGTQPTDLYDVTVTDSDGADVLHGLGANLSNAATTQKAQKDGLGAVAASKLTLNVSNAGSGKGGKAIVYLRSFIAPVGRRNKR